MTQGWLVRLVATVTALFAAVAGCRKGQEETQPAARVVARVGDRQITAADIYVVLYPQGRSPGAKADAAVAGRVLDALIERALVLNWAEENGVKVPEDAVVARVALIEADYGARGFESYLKSQGLTPAAFRARVRDDLLLENALEAAIIEKVSVSYDEVVAYYELHASDFEVPGEFHIKQILTEDRSQAEEALAKITYGTAFEDVAREYSRSPDRYSGGDVGYVSLAALPPEVAAVVAKLPVGQVSPIIKTSYGYEVVKVVGVKPAGRRPLVEVRAKIEDQIRRDREAALYTRWVASLRRTAKITIDEKALNSL